VLAAVTAAGYESCANSDRHSNGPGTSRFALGRVAVTADIRLPEFAEICQRRGLWRRELADRVRGAVKGVIETRLPVAARAA
jgi:hypothetical protein